MKRIFAAIAAIVLLATGANAQCPPIVSGGKSFSASFSSFAQPVFVPQTSFLANVVVAPRVVIRNRAFIGGAAVVRQPRVIVTRTRIR